MNTATSHDGTQIAFDQVGTGPPLILVGGAMSHRRMPPFQELASLLADHFTVICYDRRGRGDSTDTLPYSPQREVEDIDAIINAVGGSAFVWGWSSGAALSINAAAAGLNIKKLGLYEPPYVVGKVKHRPPADHLARLRVLIASGRRSEAVEFFMVQMVGLPRIMVCIMKLLPFWKKLTATAHTLPYDSEIMGDFSFPQSRVTSISIPTINVWGSKSQQSLRNAAQAVGSTLRDVKNLELAGQNHVVSMKVLAPILRDYFGA